MTPIHSHSNPRFRKTTRSPAVLAILLLAATLAPALAGSGGAPSTAAKSSSCDLRIRVSGFRNDRGNLGTVVFANPQGWPEDIKDAYRSGPAPIDKATQTAVANWKVPPGDYAIAAIHDENGNAKLDRNMLGIPKEGFGFANNPHVTLRAPSFQAAEVRVECPVTDVTIHLQYK